MVCETCGLSTDPEMPNEWGVCPLQGLQIMPTARRFDGNATHWRPVRPNKVGLEPTRTERRVANYAAVNNGGNRG